MLVQTHWLIPHRMRRTMLDSLLFVVNRLGRMDFSASTPAAWLRGASHRCYWRRCPFSSQPEDQQVSPM